MRASVQDVCLFTLTMLCIFSTILIGISATQDGITLARIHPNPDQLPCPQERTELQCDIMVPSTALTWILPDNSFLEFDRVSTFGVLKNSTNDAYGAILTDRTDDNDPATTTRFFFFSTLVIFASENGSNITCQDSTGTMNTTTIIRSSNPDAPSNLGYNNQDVIEDSVDLQWTRPSYTGGVPLDHYNITANGETRMADGDSEQFSPGLVYGQVLITAINTCGQESEPAVINIPAAAPPDVSSISAQFSCEDISSPWSVDWMYGVREEGMVYPGDVEVVVRANGTTICPDVTAADTSCTLTLPRGLYNISITQSNDIGSTADSKAFDTMILTAVFQSDKLEELRVDVTDAACPETPNGYNVRVTFGARPVETTSCVSQKNVTAASTVRSGETVQFSVDAESVSLEPGEEYCYIVSLDGVPVIIGGGGGGGTEDGAISSSALSTGAIAGIAVSSCVVVLILITVVLVVVLFITKKKKCRETEETTELKAISPGATEEGVQNPNTISRTPHPETGEQMSSSTGSPQRKKNLVLCTRIHRQLSMKKLQVESCMQSHKRQRRKGRRRKLSQRHNRRKPRSS